MGIFIPIFAISGLHPLFLALFSYHFCNQMWAQKNIGRNSNGLWPICLFLFSMIICLPLLSFGQYSASILSDCLSGLYCSLSLM
jgi:hypothetical protein